MGSWFTHRKIGGRRRRAAGHRRARAGRGPASARQLPSRAPSAAPRSPGSATAASAKAAGDGPSANSTTFDVDDFATALIRLEGGAVVSLEAAWALHQETGNDHDVVLYGEDAGLAVYAEPAVRGGSSERRVPHRAESTPRRPSTTRTVPGPITSSTCCSERNRHPSSISEAGWPCSGSWMPSTNPPPATERSCCETRYPFSSTRSARRPSRTSIRCSSQVAAIGYAGVEPFNLFGRIAEAAFRAQVEGWA